MRRISFHPIFNLFFRPILISRNIFYTCSRNRFII
nr:MAG TPA: hypothetical protein [Crassvirales sp.]